MSSSTKAKKHPDAMEIENEDSQNKNTDSKKRPHDGSFVRRKKKAKITYNQPKNAVMQLNEAKPGLIYVFEHAGKSPGCEFLFVVSVEVNGQKFFGKGCSKQAAKHAAAEAALKSFIQFRNMADAMNFRSRENITIDFTKDNLEAEGTIFGTDEPEKIISVNEDFSLWHQQKINKKLRKLIAEADKKNPVSLLCELRSGLDYFILQNDAGNADHQFKAEVNVDGKIFNGIGQSKKAAKAAAARAVLSQIYGFNFGTSQGLNEADKVMFDVPQQVADNIGKLVHNTYDVYAKETEKSPQWRILAGIVMTTDEQMENMHTICVSTGARILKQPNLNFKGEALNDCHAEVIARRCLKDFLFTQLELHVNGKGHESIFQKTNAKFKLKPHIRFHFYVTSIPCGDAAMFTLHEKPEVGGLNLDNTDHGSGVLRSKLEFGTVPVGSASNEQLIADIKRNKVKYQIMSCSDKMTLWNVLGIQGSLLSFFVEPIYFHTIVFGRPFHGYHMLNCMYKRIENTIKDLPCSFSLHKPKLACTSSWSVRSLMEMPKVCANWTCNQKALELVVSTTGKLREGSVSRLAKCSFCQRFINLHNLLLKGSPIPQSQPYDKVKHGCVEYCKAKCAAIEAFYSSGLGRWKKKPNELDKFMATS